MLFPLRRHSVFNKKARNSHQERQFEVLEERRALTCNGVLPGDLDGNCEVAFADFLILSANFGVENATAEQGDIDGNGTVDFEDFLALSENFGMEPEPRLAQGRLLVADAVDAHLSVVDLWTGEVNTGAFEIAAPGATVYSSPSNLLGFVVARGPEAEDDRVHVFDGGVRLVPHLDHFDLVKRPVFRNKLEIVKEWPVHFVNSRGWSAIFTDTDGHVVLINEQEMNELALANSDEAYEPIVLEAGIQHGNGFVISEDHVIYSVNAPDCSEFVPGGPGCLPNGVQISSLEGEVVYDAASDICPSLHGESENAHGAVFGCFTGVLLVSSQDGQYQHEIIPYPEEAGENLAMGQYFGHPDSDNFFAPATIFPEGGFPTPGGLWMVDVVSREMREVFPAPSVSAAYSSDGDAFYMLAADGILRTFDADSGEVAGSMQLVDPFEMVFGMPSPEVNVVGEMMYVADPNSGRVIAVDLTDMKVEKEWEVGGAPTSLAFVGVQ